MELTEPNISAQDYALTPVTARSKPVNEMRNILGRYAPEINTVRGQRKSACSLTSERSGLFSALNLLLLPTRRFAWRQIELGSDKTQNGGSPPLSLSPLPKFLMKNFTSLPHGRVVPHASGMKRGNAANVLTHVAFQIRQHPFCQGINVNTSSRLPSERLRLGSSSVHGTASRTCAEGAAEPEPTTAPPTAAGLPRTRDGEIDYDALYEDESDNDLGSMENHGSVVTHLLSQVKIGMDLTKVVLPTFILERRSLLEMYADYFAHPDQFVKIVDFPTPRERMVQVVRWYLSSYHAGRKSQVAKKPYNPILGEVFRCHWELDPIENNTNGVEKECTTRELATLQGEKINQALNGEFRLEVTNS
ncbi:Oxysterol-binding protein-related protein 9 [Eumeta japonica]|uniref:Oxysterol-binding protein-related protein 9 n=1 Tax=Eumeta variegata TaxID=151549 RepID=A0A4C1XIC2_EUMVA|nr:Oxysterol-binding protein-related protein 9 [Eumeta japonica]